MEDDIRALRGVRHFLLDLDGTIYLGANLIPGAAEFIQYLRETDRKYLFFTNNSSKNAEEYAEKLARLGIPATPADILTSGEATVRYLLEQTTHRKLFVVGMPSFEEELTRAGFTLTEKGVDAVVLAFDRSLTYGKLERACLLLRENLPYFATNPDKVCPTDYGYIPDCGSIAALLHEASGRTPIYIGKPNPEMVRIGMEKLGGAIDSTAMIGDRLYTDMQMAYTAGIVSVLVLSGETKRENLGASAQQPHFVFDSVKGLRDALAGSTP
ncbi:MAG: HAD-IIA family hydrolase [Candidatus Hydrogenedentes bacterium]|nr:HAD-IIA family hydrolase [Candidatus Hydrogenedentota bacterium]